MARWSSLMIVILTSRILSSIRPILIGLTVNQYLFPKDTSSQRKHWTHKILRSIICIWHSFRYIALNYIDTDEFEFKTPTAISFPITRHSYFHSSQKVLLLPITSSWTVEARPRSSEFPWTRRSNYKNRRGKKNATITSKTIWRVDKFPRPPARVKKYASNGQMQRSRSPIHHLDSNSVQDQFPVEFVQSHDSGIWLNGGVIAPCMPTRLFRSLVLHFISELLWGNITLDWSLQLSHGRNILERWDTRNALIAECIMHLYRELSSKRRSQIPQR